MKSVTGILIVALVVLGTVWAYNRFSGKSIGSLGVKAS